jgi:hypothetical protein
MSQTLSGLVREWEERAAARLGHQFRGRKALTTCAADLAPLLAKLRAMPRLSLIVPTGNTANPLERAEAVRWSDVLEILGEDDATE